MVTLKQIKDFGNRLGHEFHAQQVLLFGSYAQGQPTEDSDVDLLVIMPFKGHSVHQSVAMRMKLKPNFPIDLLVRNPQQIQQRLDMGDQFIQQILQEGVLLYDAHNP